MNLTESGQDITPAGEAMILTGVALGTALIYWGTRVASKWIVESVLEAKFEERQFYQDQSDFIDNFINNRPL